MTSCNFCLEITVVYFQLSVVRLFFSSPGLLLLFHSCYKLVVGCGTMTSKSILALMPTNSAASRLGLHVQSSSSSTLIRGACALPGETPTVKIHASNE